MISRRSHTRRSIIPFAVIDMDVEIKVGWIVWKLNFRQRSRPENDEGEFNRTAPTLIFNANKMEWSMDPPPSSPSISSTVHIFHRPYPPLIYFPPTISSTVHTEFQYSPILIASSSRLEAHVSSDSCYANHKIFRVKFTPRDEISLTVPNIITVYNMLRRTPVTPHRVWLEYL